MTNQHLLHSIVEIIKPGGVIVGSGDLIMPDPMLIDRDENNLNKRCKLTGKNESQSGQRAEQS